MKRLGYLTPVSPSDLIMCERQSVCPKGARRTAITRTPTRSTEPGAEEEAGGQRPALALPTAGKRPGREQEGAAGALGGRQGPAPAPPAPRRVARDSPSAEGVRSPVGPRCRTGCSHGNFTPQ